MESPEHFKPLRDRSPQTLPPDFKRKLVEQGLVADTSGAAITLEHQLNANLLHKWRRQHMAAARAPAKVLGQFAPILL